MQGVVVHAAVLILAGVVLVTVVLHDAITTTLSVSAKSGWLTRTVSGLLWRLLLRLSRSPRLSPLARAGVIILLANILTWVVLLWTGMALIFAAGSPAVVGSSTGAAASTVELIYYVGFTLSTLGVGDFVPAGAPWQTLTALASFIGLMVITLAITYVLSVVDAVVSRRSFAVHVHALGTTPAEIVADGWTGEAFSAAYVQHLVSLTQQVATLAEQDLAYPVLHYFHPTDRTTAGAPAVVNLSEAVMLMEAAVAEHARAPRSATRPVQSVVVRNLATSQSAGSVHARTAPPLPDLTPLHTAGVPLVPHDQFVHHAALRAEHRRQLHELLRSEGWQWDSS